MNRIGIGQMLLYWHTDRSCSKSRQMRENETVVTAEKMTTDRRIEFELTNVDNLKIQVASFLKN